MAFFEIWITSAEDDDLARDAINLVASLRRSQTRKPVLIVCGRALSSEMRKNLELECDYVSQLNIDCDDEALKFQNAVKDFVRGIPFLDRGIFISHSVLVLKNIDFLFEMMFENSKEQTSGAKEETVEGEQSNEYLYAISTCLELEVKSSEIKNRFYKFGLDISSDFQTSLEATEIPYLVNLPKCYSQECGFNEVLEKLGVLGNIISNSLTNLKQIKHLKAGVVPLERMKEEPIVIIGMAGRLPGSNNLKEFWKLLINKGDAISKVPDWRWTEEHTHKINPRLRNMKAGFLKCPVDEFDAKFFRLNPKEMEYTDPQQRLLLEVSWEALEDAGIDPHSLHGTQTGIFTGTWTHDYNDLMKKTGFAEGEFFRSYMGNAYGATAGRMAHFYGTTGSNIATESGCSSSMVAIGLACKSLRRQDTSMALACGVNLLLQPLDEESMAVFCSGDGHCKTFDENANGFGRAEGCGVLILKRLSDAIRDGDPIRAVIRGYGEAQEGTSSSLGTPTVKVEACAMSLALKDAEVNPWEVSYVEAHGTGTAVGDPIEMEAIGEVYSNDRKGPLLVTSVKTNVGHTESVSGITGIIKTVLALQNQMIPPHRSLTKLNPKINLSRIPAAIPLEVVTWPREKGKSRIAGVSSFGIAGTDAHVILEEAPELINSRQLTKLPYNILALSARTEEALGKLIQSYYKMLKSTSLKWSDVCYTASVGRAHFKEFRVAVVAKDLQRLREQVEQFPLKIIPGALTQRPVVFLFTGQGSQYFGMAKQLYEVSLKFRETFNKCDNILRNNHSIDIKQATWDDAQNSMLHESLYSQTAIFVIDYCLAELWKSWGIIPEIVLGHSLGEYAAACIAGVISFENGLKLVAGRSTIISNIPRGKMTVTNLNSEKVGQLISEFGTNGKLDIAAINSPEQTTIAGTEDCITTFKRFCDERGVKTQILDASHAFHSYMMDPALEQLEKLALSVKYEKPTCRFISGMEGKEVTTINADYWVRHTRQPVNFLKACTTLDQCGGFTALEMGPQPILSSFVATNLQNSCSNFLLLPSLRRGKDDWKKMMDSLAKIYTAGLNVKWSKIYENTEAIKINGLPTYPFQRKKFWFKKPKIESFNFVGNKLHPLTHCRISSPASLKIFESNLDLNKLTYMEDHVIGTQVIFPAAGYIEMILSAGYLSTLSEFEEFRHPRKPVHVSDLSIYAPLEMTKEKMLNIQTLVNSDEDSDKSKISIHKRMERKETSKPWSCHAEAKFTSSISDKDISNSDILDIAQLVSSLGPEDPNKFYESVHESGLKFGQTFRCIKQIWRGKMETVCQIVIPNSEENYFVHPIAIDAMIQVLLMSQQQYMSHLTLPTKIDNFSWFGICEPTDCLYIYTDRKTESASAILFDQNKRKVAEMRGVTFVPTTLANFKAALDDRNINLPAMLEEEWIPANTKTSLVPAEILSSLNFNNLIVFKDEGNETTFEHKTETQGTRLEEVAALMAMRALLDLGWKPEVGENIVATKFVEKFGIAEKFNLMTRRLFDIVSLHSIYLSGRDFNFNVTNVFPTLQEIGLKLKELELSQTDYETEIKCVRLVSTSSTQVLHGEESMLPVLFGDDSLAENVYTNFKSAIDCSKSLQTTLQSICQQIKAENVTGLHKLRILEIGGGTGSFTKNILPVLDKSGFEYSYIFTDISPSFLSCAKTLLYKWNDIMEFKVLDIEKCLESQGFQAEDFDIVIAVHVLHATRNLTETLVNVRHTLKPNGLLILAELCKANPIIDLIFGYVDGYWCFEDKEIRPLHCILPEERWPSVLNSSGFTDFKLLKGHESNGIILSQANATIINSSSQKLQDWILFTGSSQFEFTKDLKSKLLENSTRLGDTSSQVWKSEILNGTIKGVIILSDPSCPDSSELAKLFLEIIQTILSPGAASPKIIIVTVGGVRVGDHKIVSPNGGILWGMSRTLRSENSDLHITNIDLDPNATCESNAEVLLRLLWSSKEDFIAVRNNQLFKLRLKSVKIQDSSLQLPAIPNQFELILPKSNKINDLTFGTLQKNIVGGNEVVIQVKAAALNFRDLFSVLKPTEDFTKSAAVGSDMAGVITAIGSKVKRFKVGDAVTGYFYDSGGLPSHVTVSSDLVAKLPPNWTFEDGSTLPTAYATAYYSLVTVGKLQKGETVLIHTASGGVGLAAIQVAKNVGARIFATAGSQRKQTHLKEITNLKDISSSRQLAYKEDILSVTDGLGVDLVLNSLTGPGFKEATLDVCSTGGRFIEMSKLNIWSEEDVKKLRPDVQYTIVDLISISKDTSKNLLQKLEKQMENGSIHPLPYDLFRSVDIRTAFEHLQKAKHIGKVVCKMPKQHEDRRYFLFNDRSTYLITGGLGAIGLEAAKWMTNEGAKFIVLCGRNLPSKHATEVIESLNIDGKCVISYQLDISDKEGCTRLIEAINSGRLHFNNQSFPPLRGIQHAAGIISDATFANQTWEKYEETFRGKVYGALNLHELTKNAKYPLEHFVMHSSFAAIIGLIGQSNYAAANAYLDSLANYRNSLGLPATSINWGQWGNIGMSFNLEFSCLNPFKTHQAFAALQRILRHHQVHVSVVEADIAKMRNIYPWLWKNGYASIFGQQKLSPKEQSASELITSEVFWKEFTSVEDEAEKLLEFLIRILSDVIRQTLRLEPTEAIDIEGDMGIDSLMRIELRNILQCILGPKISLTVNGVSEAKSVKHLAMRVREIILQIQVKQV